MTVLVGEVANFTAYAFAPAVLVTPLGALSIIVRFGPCHPLPAVRLVEKEGWEDSYGDVIYLAPAVRHWRMWF